MRKSEKEQILKVRKVLEGFAQMYLSQPEPDPYAIEIQDCADLLFEIANRRDSSDFAMRMGAQMANNILQDYERGIDHGEVLVSKATFFQEAKS